MASLSEYFEVLDRMKAGGYATTWVSLQREFHISAMLAQSIFDQWRTARASEAAR